MEGRRTSSAITPIRQKVKRKIIRQWGNKPIARKRKRRESRKRIKGKRKKSEKPFGYESKTDNGKTGQNAIWTDRTF